MTSNVTSDVTSDLTAAAIPRINPLFRLQWEAAQDNWVLLYPEGMIKLNQSAGEILKRCDGERTINAIVSDLESSFSTTGLERDVIGFVEIALKNQWLKAG